MDRPENPSSSSSNGINNRAGDSRRLREAEALLHKVDAHLVDLASHPADLKKELYDEAGTVLHRLKATLNAPRISLADLDTIRAELEHLDRTFFDALIEACELFLGMRTSELPDLALFRDRLGDEAGPEMVVIPSGRFMMGSPEDEHDRDDAESPRHEVVIEHRYCLARYPVTFEEYDAFCRATGRALPNDRFWGRGRLPVINVVWEDAIAYCGWLSELTGAEYRLPSEAEWEYACRAGTSMAYPWGSEWDPNRANGSEGGPGRTTLVGSYPANGWGLYDMIGNIREWVSDSWHACYEGAPTDGSAWEGKKRDCRVVRGGSWFFYPRICRAAFRFWFEPDVGVSYLGFRPARSLSQGSSEPSIGRGQHSNCT